MLHLVGCNLELYYDARTHACQKHDQIIPKNVYDCLFNPSNMIHQTHLICSLAHSGFAFSQTNYSVNFHSCTMHSDVIQSFISQTNAQPICFKILKFTLKYTLQTGLICSHTTEQFNNKVY